MVGDGKNDDTNPIYLASTPVWDELVGKSYRRSLRQAVGSADSGKL
jgi:hypothetical protein